MDDSTGEQSRLSCPQTREEMKLQEGGSVLPQEEGPSGRCREDGRLLAATLLLVASCSCLTALALCWAAALQAELGSLRAELRGRPGAPQAGAAPGLNQRIFAPPAPGESNSSQSGRSKRGLPEADEAVTQDCLQLIADSDTPTIRKGNKLSPKNSNRARRRFKRPMKNYNLENSSFPHLAKTNNAVRHPKGCGCPSPVSLHFTELWSSWYGGRSTLTLPGGSRGLSGPFAM
ncbi:tumor necrosis factor ligand superfamily member 13B isoform X3 [Moschus berezovskii]|uniref:tumor necrosis factor ligand superfamily member 13B isoform X3 n=1 Tax=Moschus berezovskii TaxID=68408 RepID=UPI002444D3D6|nr:tumor necrosis factor ligand superfamily member 13B isoform X3 [Moschus berezovskii]